MNLLSEYMIPWVISNSIAILGLVAAIRNPKRTRILFAILFIWACWLNYTTVHKNPNEYLIYAALTPFRPYFDFINGWFKLHIVPIVTLISIGQGLIAIGFILKGRMVRLACFGAIVFFLAIAPLGIGSAFPATLIASVAIYFILKNDDLNYLWKLK